MYRVETCCVIGELAVYRVETCCVIGELAVL